MNHVHHVGLVIRHFEFAIPTQVFLFVFFVTNFKIGPSTMRINDEGDGVMVMVMVMVTVTMAWMEGRQQYHWIDHCNDRSSPPKHGIKAQKFCKVGKKSYSSYKKSKSIMKNLPKEVNRKKNKSKWFAILLMQEIHLRRKICQVEGMS